MNDQELVRSVISGNEKAFQVLVEQHQQMVLNTCMGLVHQRNDAEDLAQEVFVEVYRSMAGFRSDSKLSTWIYRIAINKSLNFIRDNKRRKLFRSFETIFGQGQPNLPSESSSDRPDRGLENKQRRERLHAAIDSLPERQRVAFTLNKFEDLPYQKIAEVMGLSLASVESLIHRAKLNLQKKLYKCYKKDD
ncbi:RNA polymerase sigma factor [Gaoshiqia sediminis]|uniref:RNA polymerase sigma factor n=1 Tax=Gaoshiqia sediminis TaxID=2986998 RepID=A0AA41Y9Y4_9BACT|nr:sigma-70 family RNA polymerase sigma factor [Gaoshiqia sediminis]MCW0482168.1 sigma-70 family RNA polymerase sigma factor [Gaoshiqia sediminis]